MKKNSLKSLLTISKYSLVSHLRNPSTIFFGFLFPFIFILVFGLLGQGSSKFSIGVLDDSKQTGPAYDAISSIDVFEFITDKSDVELQESLSKGEISAIMDIDEINNELQGQKYYTYELNLQTTSADPEGGETVKSILGSVINAINNPPVEGEQKIVELNIENIEGRKYERIDFILPGQLNFSLLSTGVFGIAFTFIVLKRELIIKRFFATPTPRWTIIVGEVLSRLVIAVLQATFIILIGHFAFHFTLANGVLTFLSMMVLSGIALVVFFGLGLLISTIAKDENAVPSIANLVTLPQFLLSGTFFPIEVFPEFLQPVARVLPLTFLNDAMRKISFEGASLLDVGPEILGLVGWGVLFYIVVIKIFKWE